MTHLVLASKTTIFFFIFLNAMLDVRLYYMKGSLTMWEENGADLPFLRGLQSALDIVIRLFMNTTIPNQISLF